MKIARQMSSLHQLFGILRRRYGHLRHKHYPLQTPTLQKQSPRGSVIFGFY